MKSLFREEQNRPRFTLFLGLFFFGMANDFAYLYRKAFSHLATAWPINSKIRMPIINVGLIFHQIIYGAKSAELILDGKAEVNGTCHDFIFNISEPVLETVYEKEMSNSDSDRIRVLPNSFLQTFTFTGYNLIIESNISTENEIIKSPNNQILPQLASSWLNTIFNAVNDRFVKPKIYRHNYLFFKTSKDRFLKDYAASIANKIDWLSTFGIITFQKTDLDYDYPVDEYTFEDINVTNFKNFQDCFTSSQSVFVDHRGQNLYSHRIDLMFTNQKDVIFESPTVEYFSRRRQKNRYNNYRSENENKMFNRFLVEQWSIRLLIFTNQRGIPVNNHEAKIDVDFEMIKSFDSPDRSLRSDETQFIELFEKSVAESLKPHVWNYLWIMGIQLGI